MSTVEEIEKAIGDLPREDFWKLTDRLIERRESAWDAQIEADAKAGLFDSLWGEAEKEIEAGETQSLEQVNSIIGFFLRRKTPNQNKNFSL